MSSEAVRVIRDILPGVSDSTLKELRSLVAYSMAAPSPSELREQRLGLLVEIVAAAPSRIPLGEEYENERASRIESGEAWPSRSQLSRAYGSWLLAVSAAMELDRPRGDTLPPGYQARPVSGRRNTRQDTIRAIVRCHDDIGTWPTQSDYLQWLRILRHTGRLYGPGEPRLPARRPYGDYSVAGHARETQLEDGSTATPEPTAPKETASVWTQQTAMESSSRLGFSAAGSALFQLSYASNHETSKCPSKRDPAHTAVPLRSPSILTLGLGTSAR
jgi:hypothetical protein